MKFAVLIDGGFARRLAGVKSQNAGYYSPVFIRNIYEQCSNVKPCSPDGLLRVLYYDAPPFKGMVRLPVSKKRQRIAKSDSFLNDLATFDYVAVRRGQLRFKAWAPKKKQPMKDEDYRPVYEQKGVDTRIALDIVNFCKSKAVDCIILFSGDTDLIPALKYARIAGLQTVLLQLPSPARKLTRKLVAHSDLVLDIEWPPEPPASNSP